MKISDRIYIKKKTKTTEIYFKFETTYKIYLIYRKAGIPFKIRYTDVPSKYQ